MKIISLYLLSLPVLLLPGNFSYAQTPAPYKLADNYRFDYEVVQKVSGERNGADSSDIHFFCTKSGDYAGASMLGKKKNKMFILLTKDGMSAIFDEQSKNIIVINVRKLVTDLAGLMKYIRMDSLMAQMKKNSDGKEIRSVKTGHTKPVGSYTSEEYTLSENGSQRGSVWIARVDFNTPMDYMLGALGGNWIKMMMGQQTTTHPLFEALGQPKTLITSVDLRDSAGAEKMKMNTLRIDPVATTVSTSGYSVSDYSNMTLREIFQAEMKKRNLENNVKQM
jgi:hypothetical protein